MNERLSLARFASGVDLITQHHRLVDIIERRNY